MPDPEGELVSELGHTEVPKGLSTYLGIVFALGQYAGAIALFAASSHDSVAIAALSTATATAVATILGRMYQAAQGMKPADITVVGSGSRVDQLADASATLDGAADAFGEIRKSPASDPFIAGLHDRSDPVMAKDDDADEDDPGDDEDFELDVDEPERLEHAPDQPDGGPPDHEVAPVPAHTHLREEGERHG